MSDPTQAIAAPKRIANIDAQKQRHREAIDFARRIRKTVKAVGAPGLVEELEDFRNRAAMETLIEIADTLGISTDQCLGRGVGIGVGIIRVQPDMAWQLERIRQEMPFLGDDLHELAAIRSVPERMDEQLDGHARSEGLRTPALPRQSAGAAQLDRPVLRLTFIGNRQHDPGMGIGPLEFLDGAFQRRRLVGIEHGKGMMREGGERKHGSGDARKTEYLEFHGSLQLVFLWPKRTSRSQVFHGKLTPS
jgi:hypothetical protein